MTDRHVLKLTPSNRAKALQGIDAAIAIGRKGEPWTMELRERTRSDEQNRAIHSLIGQILKQRPTLNGVAMDKVTLKATFMQALGHEMRMLPTLDGTAFFPLGLSTSKLTVAEGSALIEFILAWCAEQGLTITHFDAAKDADGANNPAAVAA